MINSRSKKKLIVKLGQSFDFVPPKGHLCSALTKWERQLIFLEVAGEIWARLCREDVWESQFPQDDE